MFLTKPEIKDLKKVAVKIFCQPDNGEGSGTIVLVNDVFYVLTAAHVIQAKDKEAPLPADDIKVALYRNSNVFNLRVIDIPLFDIPKDVAVMIVENTENAPVSGLDKVSLLAKEIAGEATLCGYRWKETNLRINQVNRRASGIWTVDINLTSQNINAQANFEATSGGGVFYSDNEGGLYLSAYMTGIHSYRGTNNEIDCPSALEFARVEALKSIVDESDYQFVQETGEAGFFNKRQKIKPLPVSSYAENQTGEFLENDKTKEIIDALRDDDQPTLILTALSGMGKSKLIYEAFHQTERRNPNRYFAKYSGDEDDLLAEAAQIMKRNEDGDGIIIIDDCPLDFLLQMISCRNQNNPQFRIIAANHDYFNEKLKLRKKEEVLWLNPNDMRVRVNEYIDQNLPNDRFPEEDVKAIKELAGGYPQMAIELVSAYLKEKKAGVEVVEHLMPKLLNLGEHDNEAMTMMQTLSLCMPFPYRGKPREAFNYIINYEHITPLGPVNFTQRRSLAERLIKQYNPTLVDILGDWLHVRPFPLAVWLTAQWFKNVCNSSEHFKEMIDNIQLQEQEVQGYISEGFCKHIQQMTGDKAAFELVGELVRRDVNDPFFNEEVICSGLGSQLFLAMSTVNPAAVAECIYDIVKGKSFDWLKNEFDGDGRRNVVWALEKLCFAKESYEKAVQVLAKLAIAENENYGNNATAQLNQLFHVQLAGTEVDLTQRFNTLKKLVDLGDAYLVIALRCISEAFRNGQFVKMGGAEKFGFENKKDYAPKSYKEIYDYWYDCRDLLISLMTTKPSSVNMVAKVVVDNTFQWIRDGNWNVLNPLIEKVVEIRGNKWDDEYEQLERARRLLKENEIGKLSLEYIEQWIEKIRPSSFITDLKEARNQLWADYRMKDEDIVQLSAQLFDPLADKFIAQEIYKNEDEVRLILNDNEYIDNRFAKKISETLSHEEITEFFDVILKVVLEGDDNYHSSFLLSFCDEAKDREELLVFLKKLYDNDRKGLYIRILAFAEHDDLRNFYRIGEEEKSCKLPKNSLVTYLSYFRAITKSRYENMVKAINENYPEDYKLLVDFVLIHRIFMDHDEDLDCKSAIRNAIIHYPVVGDSDRNFYEYIRLVVHILEHTKEDKDFAKAINHKMIELYNSKFVHLNSEGLFTELLRDYRDVIWDEFIEKFLSPDYYLFYFQVKDELGSGFGFGTGPFFELGDELIKDLCLKHPDSAPARIASMAPCYDAVDKDAGLGGNERFSSWFIWLLDNFGSMKEVRDSLHANLGSYSWTGTTIPLHQTNIKCFENLYNHTNPDVVEWAHLCAKDEKTMLEREQSSVDFMKLRYDM